MENDFNFSLYVNSTSTARDGRYTGIAIEGDELTYTVTLPWQNNMSFSRSCKLTPEDMEMLFSAGDYLSANKEEIAKHDMILKGGNRTISGSKDGAPFSFVNNFEAAGKIDDLLEYVLSTKEVDIREEVNKEVEEWLVVQKGKEPEDLGGKVL